MTSRPRCSRDLDCLVPRHVIDEDDPADDVMRDVGVDVHLLVPVVLLELCRRLPGDESELLAVPGMGPARIERYGQDVLELVRSGPGAGVSRPPMPV